MFWRSGSLTCTAYTHYRSSWDSHRQRTRYWISQCIDISYNKYPYIKILENTLKWLLKDYSVTLSHIYRQCVISHRAVSHRLWFWKNWGFCRVTISFLVASCLVLESAHLLAMSKLLFAWAKINNEYYTLHTVDLIRMSRWEKNLGQLQPYTKQSRWQEQDTHDFIPALDWVREHFQFNTCAYHILRDDINVFEIIVCHNWHLFLFFFGTFAFIFMPFSRCANPRWQMCFIVCEKHILMLDHQVTDCHQSKNPFGEVHLISKQYRTTILH